MVGVKLPLGTQQAVIYIMNDKYPNGVPDRHYYEGIFDAYQEFNLDTGILEKALDSAVKADPFFNQDRCTRCGAPLTIRTMSRMNSDTICPACAREEKSHPRYQEAAKAELEQVKAGLPLPRTFCRSGLSV
jgi:hypothetical protein